MYYSVLHMTGSREDAREITQETFLRMIKGVKGLREPERFFPWLMKIASNLVKDRFRARSPETLEADWEGVSGSQEEEPFHRLDAFQTRERLLEVLALLPARQRMAVVLRIYNELSFKDVAQIMGCQVATARSLFWAGVREMRKKMEGER